MQADSRTARGRATFLAAVLALAMGSLIVSATASRHTSITFDEIVMIGGGARGWQTGRFDLQPEHPPLMLYLYGLPVWLSHPQYPPTRPGPDWRTVRDVTFRFSYAREFLWAAGNDAERLAFLGRSVGAVLAALLVLVTFGFARRFGWGPGLLAAALVAFLPDVLAHGGVAYNDLPLALTYLLAIWALDHAVRAPTAARGALAGLAVALALGVKFSAVVLLPAASLLGGLELMARRADPRWLRAAGTAMVAGLLAAYLALVVMYRGDVTLAEMRYGLGFTFSHASQGHGVPGYLLGRFSATGWWYFFPVAFLFKTPAALHLLLLAALVGFARVSRTTLAATPLRAPLVGLLVFGAALVTSSLVIGFRYALPALPMLCIVVAAGVGLLWARGGRLLRVALVAAAVWHAGSSLSYYPYFLSYISEYGPGRDRGDEVLLDSSLDWGQGLLALRGWMRAHRVERVYLSYFGSSLPAGYGIDYVPMPSFFPLPSPGPPPAEAPKYAVIAATNLHGVYLSGDPFAPFRRVSPDTVLARSLFVYRIDEPPH